MEPFVSKQLIANNNSKISSTNKQEDTTVQLEIGSEEPEVSGIKESYSSEKNWKGVEIEKHGSKIAREDVQIDDPVSKESNFGIKEYNAEKNPEGVEIEEHGSKIAPESVQIHDPVSKDFGIEKHSSKNVVRIHNPVKKPTNPTVLADVTHNVNQDKREYYIPADVTPNRNQDDGDDISEQRRRRRQQRRINNKVLKASITCLFLMMIFLTFIIIFLCLFEILLPEKLEKFIDRANETLKALPIQRIGVILNEITGVQLE